MEQIGYLPNVFGHLVKGPALRKHAGVFQGTCHIPAVFRFHDDVVNPYEISCSSTFGRV